jgi:DUF1365 family protein
VRFGSAGRRGIWGALVKELPALYDGHVTHVRREPFVRVFRHRTYLWLVDLDDLPHLPWWLRPFAQWRASDHLGDPERTIRNNVDAWLAAQGEDIDGGQILMLASARVLGHVFNPLTVYWCHRPDGTLTCVVAEVCNTYGQRHCYLLRLDSKSCAEVGKEFYVSPFFEVKGRYRMRFPRPAERLSLTVTLCDRGRTVFTAVLSGRRRPADLRGVARLVTTRPLMPQRVSALIRLHGFALWLRGLPIAPRAHPSMEDSR